MRAKLYLGADLMEIRLATSEDKQFFSTPNEDQTEFVARVSKLVQEEYLEDLEILNFTDLKKTKARTTPALEHRITLIPNGVEKELILEVLNSRKIKLSKELQDNTFDPAGFTHKIEDVSGKKPAKEKTPKTLKEPKNVPAAEETPGEPEQTKEERVAALEAFKKTKTYKTAHASIGKSATYTTRNYEGERQGIVKSILISKDITKIYYMVVNVDTGKRESCKPENITINE
jgi:hypothetical protein